MSIEARRFFAEGLRARRNGATGLIGGDEREWLQWAMRCGLQGPIRKLP